MELYNEILIKILQKQKMVVSFPDIKIELEEMIEAQSYKALKKIKAIILDDSLEDRECFMRIEEIVSTFEEFGIRAGNRHDF